MLNSNEISMISCRPHPTRARDRAKALLMRFCSMFMKIYQNEQADFFFGLMNEGSGCKKRTKNCSERKVIKPKTFLVTNFMSEFIRKGKSWNLCDCDMNQKFCWRCTQLNSFDLDYRLLAWIQIVYCCAFKFIVYNLMCLQCSVLIENQIQSKDLFSFKRYRHVKRNSGIQNTSEFD